MIMIFTHDSCCLFCTASYFHLRNDETNSTVLSYAAFFQFSHEVDESISGGLGKCKERPNPSLRENQRVWQSCRRIAAVPIQIQEDVDHHTA